MRAIESLPLRPSGDGARHQPRPRLRWALALSALATAQVGCDDGGGSANGDSPTGPTATNGAPVTAAVCAAPTALADISQPTVVVGAAGAPPCTPAGLQTALDGGGVITFACGGTAASPFVLTLTQPLTVDKDAVVDGGGTVTLSGNRQTRILKIGHDDFESAAPHVTLQRLTFIDGFTSDAQNTGATDKGGAAIYRVGGTLTVLDSTFRNNHGPDDGQDVAGGAIYSIGGGETIIGGSTFSDNRCSNGGALGVLGAKKLTVFNSVLSNNRATGTGANPGNGGNGGAISFDGPATSGSCSGATATGPFVPIELNLCGVTLTGNRANAFGGAVFRTVDTTCVPSRTGPVTIDRTTVADNTAHDAGGAYLHQVDLTMSGSTIASNHVGTNGTGGNAGGLWLEGSDGADITVNLTNVTIAGNAVIDGLAGGVFFGDHIGGGTFLHVTIAQNSVSTAGNPYAVFGAGTFGAPGTLVLRNSLVAGNTKPNQSNDAANCQTPFQDGGGNIQFPADPAPHGCAAGAMVVDPLLGTLADHGGPVPTIDLPMTSAAAHFVTTSCAAIDARGTSRTAPCSSGAFQP